MLVCPKCQCKNPINHKFCQKCGISLIKKNCPECGTQINVSDLTCHECGAKTGKTWWGIMVPKTQAVTPKEEVRSEFPSPAVATEEPLPIEQPIPEASDSPADPEAEDVLSAFNQEEVPQESEMATAIDRAEEVAAENEAESSTSTEDIDYPEDSMAAAAILEASETTEETDEADILTAETPETTEPPETIAPTFTEGDYFALDDYLDDDQRYKLIELKEKITTSGELQGSVLDRQPFQISPLLTSFSASQSTPRSGSTTIIQSASMLPPAIAEPYLQLRNQWSPMIPLIHDAWETEDYSIVLIEERSALPPLIDRCHQATESADFQQILQWFKQMTELWQVLTPLNCGTSLLKIENLLVDPETQALRLQRLYPDSSKSPSLTDLGKLWQELLPPTILSLETEEASETEEVESDESSDPKLIQQLIQLVHDVINEEILTSDKLLANIQNIAQPPEDEEFSDDDISTVMMTPGLKSLAAVGATDVGQQRSHNEDDFAIDTQKSQQQTSRMDSTQFQGLYIVCDGMGGHDGGEVASAKAVETLQQYFATHWQDPLMLPDEASIREAVLSANQAIYDLNQEEIRSGSGRMGTTLVMALVNNHQIAIAHVGDSRVYRLTQSKGLEQITVDHEVGQREIQRGIDPEMAYSRPDAYQLTQALGPRPENFVQPGIQFLPIEEDALFILASDGLTDNDLLENHLSSHLQPLLNSEADLKQGVLHLIALANDYNGHDNITAILIRALVKH